MVTTSTEPPVTSPWAVIVTNNKVNPSPQVLKAAPIGQGKKISERGKVLSHLKKERKALSNQLQAQPLWLALLLT